MSHFKKQLDRVAAALELGFNKDNLTAQLFQRAKNFIKNNAVLLKNEGANIDLFENSQLLKNPNKMVMAQICAVPFSSKKCYETFLAGLSEPVQKVWNELIWTDWLHQNEIERRFGVKIYHAQTIRYSANYSVSKNEVLPEFNIFQQERVGGYDNPQFLLKLPLDFRRILIDYHEKPLSAQLLPAKNLSPTRFRYETGERDILTELPRILAFNQQGQISSTTKDRPNPLGLLKMQRSLGIHEFFTETEQKRSKTLRTGMLAALAIRLKSRMITGNVPQLVRDIFRGIYLEKMQSAPAVLPDLKGMNSLNDHDFLKRELAIFELFKKLPGGEWVAFENIKDHVRFNLIDLKILQEWYAEQKLYYEYEEKGSEYSYDNKHAIKKEIFHDAVVLPFLRGSFFLFSAFGLCDLAYDEADFSEMGRRSFSSWDGLKYVRRTALGDFVCGISKTYDASAVAVESKITLSPDTLMIVFDESDTSAGAILEPYAERLGANRFRTDNQIFLKNIKSKKELEAKIVLFKQVVGSSLPKNWESFFREMMLKINPFESPGEVVVLKIPAENRSLIQLVAQDPVLKNLVVKAEGFLLIVAKENYAAFRRRLQEFGYLLT